MPAMNDPIKYIYYDYVGRPARISLVENDIPDTCEVWDSALKKLVRDDSIMLDVMEAYESRMISAAEFAELLKRS
jgi:hypothetical protein